MKYWDDIKANLQPKLAPYIDKGYERWDELNNREQLIVTVLVVVLILALFMVTIYFPLLKKRDEAMLQYQNNAELLGWMVSVAPQAKGLSSSGDVATQSAQSMMNTVNQAAQTHQLKLDRVQPEGRNKLRVWLQDVSFDGMMRWLADLQDNSGIVVSSITIDGGKRSGIISARVVLSGGSQ
jgi:general secretion pathway protein M